MLSVYSSPSGATLFIDGISVGTTPYTTSTLPAGTHAITLKLSGYADYTDSLVTVASNPVTKQYTLVPVTTPVPVSFIPIRPGTVTPTATATAVPELRLTVVPRVSFTALPRVSPVTTPVASAMVPAEPGARVSNATLPNLQNIRPFYGVQKQTVGQYSRNVYYTSIRPASSLTLDNPSQTILLISKSSSDKLTCKPEKNIAGGGQAEKNDYASDENDCQIVTTYGWGESMTQFNVSPDLKNYPFLWATHAENVSRGEWQVSNFPFPDREKSWSNPPDLVAYGTVQGRPAPSTIFTIPFDSFTDLAYGAAPVNADLMNQRPTYMLAQPGRFSGISTYQIEAGKWISGVSVGNSGVGIVSTRFNIGSVSFAVPTGIAMMPSPDTIPYASGTVYGDTITRMKFVPGALSTRMASRDRVYYIRMVALDANGNAVDKPSPDVELDIRAAPLYLFPGDEKTSAWVSPNDDGCRHGEFDTPCDASDIASLNNGASERTTLSQSWTTEVSMSVNDLNQLLFKWTSGEQNVHAGEWQLLNTKYPLDETDWEHPHGFVAEGQISTGKYFPIDLQKYNLASGNYYLRVLPLDAGNNALGPPSGLLKITVTDAPVTTVVNCDAQNVIKDRRPPSISLISYTPIQSGKPDAELHFIWANDCSSGCLPFGPHHKGDKISFQPHENSWWDDFVDAIGDVISFVGDLVNWVSDAWNSIKNEAVSLVASAIPGCSGSDACTGALSGALDYGLTAMGVPPTLPTFSDLENMGTNYMVELGTSEIGADG
ncbi:MAG TPA: PEGA domain-containing protein, partial [Methanoregula sp.]|nr:PEGA domain-containing protein [Methanoregula sp.]